MIVNEIVQRLADDYKVFIHVNVAANEKRSFTRQFRGADRDYLGKLGCLKAVSYTDFMKAKSLVIECDGSELSYGEIERQNRLAGMDSKERI